MKYLKNVLPEMLEHCAHALKVLAHPVRLQIVDHLVDEKIGVVELAKKINLPQAETSVHLKKMLEASLLEVERDGRFAYYTIANSACVSILQCVSRQIEQNSKSSNVTPKGEKT